MSRIKDARKAANMTQMEVANRIGLSQPQYSAWENGRSKIDSVSLAKLANLFGVTTDFLLGKDELAMVGSTGIRIPVLGSVPAGIPLEAIEDIIDWEELPQSMCTGGKEYFALEVKGDSMWPEYLPGDTVIIQKTPQCESGDVCVVYVNGYDATLKQVKFSEDGSMTLIPRNQNYPPRTYSPDEIQSLPVSICGIVVELRRKVKNGKGLL